MSDELYKRGGKWHVRATIKRPGHERGFRVREATGCAERGAAAVYWAARKAQLLEAAIFGERAAVSYQRAALSYIKDGKEPRSPATCFFVERLVNHFGTKIMLAEVMGPNAQSLLDGAVRAIVGDDAAPATKNRGVITPHNAILRHASRRGWCARPDFERPPQSEGKTRWLTPAEALALEEGAAPHLKPLLRFLLCTGARLSEAIELQWSGVDLTGARVIFPDTKNGSARIARLSPAAILALANLPKRAGAVFLTDEGKPYVDRERQEGGQIRTAWRTACTRAQIREATPHDLRHTWATWFYAITKDPLLLKNEGGWKKAQMVERYAHLMPAELVTQIRLVWGDSHPRIGALPGTPVTQAALSSPQGA